MDKSERATIVRLVVLDCDGVLTDGRVWVDANGAESVAFDRRDGDGLRRLRGAGIEVVWITREQFPFAAISRARKLGVPVVTGVRNKAAVVRDLVVQFNRGVLCSPAVGEGETMSPPEVPATLAEVAYMGDDEPDVEAMGLVGFSVAPADAHWAARQAAHWVTERRGGRGAVRELCDLLLQARAP